MDVLKFARAIMKVGSYVHVFFSASQFKPSFKTLAKEAKTDSEELLWQLFHSRQNKSVKSACFPYLTVALSSYRCNREISSTSRHSERPSYECGGSDTVLHETIFVNGCPLITGLSSSWARFYSKSSLDSKQDPSNTSFATGNESVGRGPPKSDEELCPLSWA